MFHISFSKRGARVVLQHSKEQRDTFLDCIGFTTVYIVLYCIGLLVEP
jgi:hypothetical protein